MSIKVKVPLVNYLSNFFLFVGSHQRFLPTLILSVGQILCQIWECPFNTPVGGVVSKLCSVKQKKNVDPYSMYLFKLLSIKWAFGGIQAENVSVVWKYFTPPPPPFLMLLIQVLA